MKILIGILLFLMPFVILSWAIASNKSKNKLISYTLLSAFIFGIILQSLFEAHAHVPGSGIILFALEIISSAIILIIYFGIKFLVKKSNPKSKTDL